MKKKTTKTESGSRPPKPTARTRTGNSSSQASPTVPRPESDLNGDIPAARHETIAARAYQIYLARGGGHGRDMEDWLDAEREVATG